MNAYKDDFNKKKHLKQTLQKLRIFFCRFFQSNPKLNSLHGRKKGNVQ